MNIREDMPAKFYERKVCRSARTRLERGEKKYMCIKYRTVAGKKTGRQDYEERNMGVSIREDKTKIIREKSAYQRREG